MMETLTVELLSGMLSDGAGCGSARYFADDISFDQTAKRPLQLMESYVSALICTDTSSREKSFFGLTPIT